MKTYRVTLTHEVEASSSVEALNRFLGNDPAPDSVQVERVIERQSWQR